MDPLEKLDFYRHPLGRDDAAGVADVLATPFLTSGAVGAGTTVLGSDFGKKLLN